MLDEKHFYDFLQDKPFFIDEQNFCLGRTLEEAGEIMRMIFERRGKVGQKTDVECLAERGSEV